MTKKVMALFVSKNSETAQATATPSSLLVARPSSSRRNKDFSVAELQINAVSFISIKKVEMLCS